ncbi:MAG: tetratricopeptide repeat protein [Magnetococcus sp. XQGC-1]
MPTSLLDKAYQAFRQGAMNEAAHMFREVLKENPRSHHAMIGLASVSMRRGAMEEARYWYQRVLKEDPHNSVAFTALIGLNGGSRGTSEESRLKNLLHEQPDASHLHFALGNIYATQQRWAMAFSAYADANHLTQEKNPEILFNLAVSLDHQRRAANALSYYEKALAIVEQKPQMRVNFDVDALRQRVQALRAGGEQPQ